MSKFDLKLFNHIADFLVDHVGETERQRKALIAPTFMGYEGLYSRINWSGASRNFTVHLVKLFYTYGEVEPGKQALVLLLQRLRPQVGVSDQDKIDYICILLEYEANIYSVAEGHSLSNQPKSLKDLLRKLLEKLKPTEQVDDNTDIENNSIPSSDRGIRIGPDDDLESTQYDIPQQEKTQPTRLRLDTATPEKVDLDRTFTVAVAVGQPESKKLSEAELTNVNSGDALVTWSTDEATIDLCLEISAPECDIIGTDSHSFQLYQGHDSPNFYFELKPKTVGQISIIVRLFQEKFILGSTRAKIMVSSKQVSQIQIQIDNESIKTPAFVSLHREPLQDKFDTFSSKMNLVAELLACSSVRSRETRDTIVDNLPNDIRSRITRSQIDHADVMNIITRTLDYSNGLKDLIEVVRLYEGNSTPMNNVDAIVYLDF